MSGGHSVFYCLDRKRRLRIFSAKLPGYTFLVGTRLSLGDGAETVQPIPHLLSSVGISLSCPHLWLSGQRSAEEIAELGGGFHGCEPNGENQCGECHSTGPIRFKQSITEAYRQVPVHPKDWHFLGCQVNEG